MAGLGPEIVADVVAACGAGAAAAGEALSQALGTTVELSVGEAGTFDAAAPPEGFDGDALVVLVKEKEAGKGAAFVLPAASGLVPEWCAAPSDEEKSKLAALAEGIGAPLFGESVSIDVVQAEQVANIGLALGRAELADDAALVPLELKAEDDRTATASLLWPLSQPDAIFAEAESATSDAASDAATTSSDAGPTAADNGRSLDELPPYMKSLMRIEVPLSATLASSKQKVSDITSLGPGAIIQFEKGCDELLELYAGGQLIARGEAVKVGDKFGLQIKQVELPGERFDPLRRA